jgi:hypothetical protein
MLSGVQPNAITAATACGLGLLGDVLGCAVGVDGAMTFYRHDLNDVTTKMPPNDLLILAFGLPVAARSAGGPSPAESRRRSGTSPKLSPS